MKIFIKTWLNDLEWLGYCLRSINKFVTHDGVVIVCDNSARLMLQSMETYGADIQYVGDTVNGYITQQVFKLNAHTRIPDEHILFVDSDCVFTNPVSVLDYMSGGKPCWLKTKYGSLDGGEVWKAITEKAVGWPVAWEYMRQLPILVLRSTLAGFQTQFPKLNTKLLRLTTRQFSEFNALGAYAEKFQEDQYVFVDTDTSPPHTTVRQFWSWGGMTDEIRAEIEEVLA